MFFLKSMSADVKLNLAHTIKVIVAVLLSFLVANLLPGQHGSWIVISTVVVMMAHASLNAQYEKALSRIFGTLIGGGLGTFILFFHPNMAIDVFFLILATTLFCYIRIKNLLSQYAVVLGLITYTLLVMNPAASWQLGFVRVGEIMVGITISLLVSVFIFPISSRKMLLLYLDKNWQALHDYAERILVNRISRDGDKSLRSLEQKILQRHNTIEELYSAKTIFKKYQPGKKIHLLIRYQLGIYRYVTVLDIVTHQYLIEDESLIEMDEIKSAYLSLVNVLTSVEEDSFPERLKEFQRKKVGLEEKVLSKDFSGQSKTTAAHTLIFSLSRIDFIVDRYYKTQKKIIETT